MLKLIADNTQLTVVSIGYRLAPEDPFPAGPEDCYDAAEYLVDNAKKEYGAELLFVGGEVSTSMASTLSIRLTTSVVRRRPPVKPRVFPSA